MKVLVIGLDGADFEVVSSLRAEGKLPVIGKLMEQGVFGPLTSVIPPISAPAWASFMTGNNPGKHGVFAFLEHTPGLLDIDSVRLVTSNSIRSPKLWDIVSAKGKRAYIINVPVTYPPSKVEGIMIPGFDAPRTAPDFFHPPEVEKEIERLLGHDYSADYHPQRHFGGESLARWMERYFKIEEDRIKVVQHFMNNHSWDFFMVVLSLTDKVGHICWSEGELIKKTYEKADALVGRILDELDQQVNVIIVSDHGFGPLKSYFVTNKWLCDEGFLKLNSVNILNFRKYYHFKPIDITVERIINRLGWKSLLSHVPTGFHNKRITLPFPHKQATNMVDWSKTRAYGGNFGIYINLKGREPQGIINPGKEYEELRDEIIDRLHTLTHPQNGKGLLTWVEKREDICSGPASERAPDIFFCLDNFNHIQINRLNLKKTFVSPSLTGTHRLHGIFLARGENIKKGFSIKDARIIDVAPTVLYTLGLPILSSMDGKLLEKCFESECLANRPPTYEANGVTPTASTESRHLEVDETEEISERLKHLGYLE